MQYGQKIPVYPGMATVYATMDFETFSYAGYFWDAAGPKWKGPRGVKDKGLPAIGARVYAEHPSTEVIVLRYDLADGAGVRYWRPGVLGATVVHCKQSASDVYIGRPGPWGNPFEIGRDGTRAEVIAKYRAHVLATPELFWRIPELVGKRLGCWCAPNDCHGDVLAELAGLPWPLFLHLAAGRLVEAHNAMFEKVIWQFVCQVKYGFPPLDPQQVRCSMAKARAFGLPGGLGPLGAVLGLDTQKDKEGKRLIQVLSLPQKPTKTRPATRRTREDSPAEFEAMDAYCGTDVEAEQQASERIPDLVPHELDYWLADQAVNHRGIGVDLESVQACIDVLEQALERMRDEMASLTGGLAPSQAEALRGWLGANGCSVPAVDADAVEAALKRSDLAPHVRRVLEIRAAASSASVKKLYAMAAHANRDARLCDLYNYHGARTGRDTHSDVQPGNLPKAGPKLRWCESDGCHRPYGRHIEACPWCGASAAFSKEEGWDWKAVDHALRVIKSRSVEAVEYFFGDVLLTLSGCIRGLLVAAPGHDLICSDYSSIEAVVLACLAGEDWRIKVFHGNRPMYLMSASAITGTPVEEYERYKAEQGHHHPDRQYIGKVAELALGYGGWVGGWLGFDDSGRFTEDEIKGIISKWRAASPAIVEFWGGQTRGKPWAPERFELFGLEGMAIAAVLYPGQRFQARSIGFEVVNDILFCILPSGRRVAYWRPRLEPGKWESTYTLSYEGWNTNPKNGPIGWIRMTIYGGKWAENVTQGVARDIMSAAVVRLERANYPVVLRVHDELAAEVPEGWGSVEEFESLMATMPPWATGWPIRAAGGWRRKRYCKD